MRMIGLIKKAVEISKKPADYRHLKIICGWFIIGVLIAAFYMLRHQREAVFSGDFPKLSDAEIQTNRLLICGNTTIYVTKGNIFKLPVPRLSEAVAFAVNPRLSRPQENELDFKLGTNLFGLDIVTSNQWFSDRQILSEKRSGLDVWVADMSSEILSNKWTLSNRRIFLVVGITPENTRNQANEAAKPSRLTEAVNLLCKQSAANKIETLFVPLLGSGVSGMDQTVALDSLLSGVISAARDRKCPEGVHILAFPRVNDVVGWSELHQTFRNCLRSEAIFDPKYKALAFRRLPILVAEVCAIGFALSLTAIIVGKVLGTKRRVTNGLLLKTFLIASGVEAGLFSFDNFRFQVPCPLPFWSFMICLFVIPLCTFWVWSKMGESFSDG